jgi:hypothetical protein
MALEAVLSPVVEVEDSAGSHPEPLLLVLEERPHLGGAEARDVAQASAVHDDRAAVIAIESILRSHPEETPAIFQNGIGPGDGETLLDPEVLEPEPLDLGPGRGHECKAQPHSGGQHRPALSHLRHLMPKSEGGLRRRMSAA